MKNQEIELKPACKPGSHVHEAPFCCGATPEFLHADGGWWNTTDHYKCATCGKEYKQLHHDHKLYLLLCQQDKVNIMTNSPTNQQPRCWNCIFQDTDRGFCWCPDRGATDDESVFSEITQSREANNLDDEQTCSHWEPGA